jgi:hypothetical protein
MPSHCVPGAPTTADSVQPQRRGLRCRLQRCARLHSAHSFLRPPDRGRPHTALHYQHLHVRATVSRCAQQCPQDAPLRCIRPSTRTALGFMQGIVPFGRASVLLSRIPAIRSCAAYQPFRYTPHACLAPRSDWPVSSTARTQFAKASLSNCTTTAHDGHASHSKIHGGEYQCAGTKQVMALRRRPQERSRIAT